jgi:hypothetical protein
MKWQSHGLRPGLLALLLVAGAADAAPLPVYDDQLRSGFSDWSWASRNLAQTGVVHAGSAAISFEPDAWKALFLHRNFGINTAEHEALEFWIHGGPTGGQKLDVVLAVEGSSIGRGNLESFITGGAVPAGQWARVRVPFASLGVTSGTFNGFWIQDDTGGDQPVVYVDDIQLAENLQFAGPVTVSIDPNANRRPISPLIYGVNFGSVEQANRLRWPVRRWGGNATSRYSWQHDFTNHANDWFFFNEVVGEWAPAPPNLPHGSAADRFIDETRAAGGQPLITLGTIGWTVIDRTKRWGFSVAKYGPQQETECTRSGGASWCQPDAGNGVRTDGTKITGNDPRDTSREVGTDFVTGWMSHIASRVGMAGQGGVKFFALDNEPMLWHSTHRDVHPGKVTYDELWQRTVQYATAVKAQDSAAELFGPVTWGWCDLHYSAADDCKPGPDRAAHGDMPLLEWYLKQVRDHELAYGVRLVDWIDLHYYPEGGIALSGDETPEVAARRLRSIKSLYDPNYVDESWIGKPIQLIPRVKAWIAARLPGAKLAITEYNWGKDHGLSSALAQAEVLAVFGREGVDLASRWEAPEDNSLVEDAFRLYLDYDGQSSQVMGDSVRAVSSNVDAVGAYAVRGTGAAASRLYVLLFNKATNQRHVDVQLPAGYLTGAPGTLYRFDGTQRLGPAGTAAPAGNTLSLDLPQRSATLVVLPTVG